MIITSQIKDTVLNHLCAKSVLEELSGFRTPAILKELEMDFETFNAIMRQFQRVGFIEELNIRRSDIYFILLTEANDFLRRGGFVIQDDIIKHNLLKLQLEIESLQKQLGPDHREKLNTANSILGTILTGIGLIN